MATWMLQGGWGQGKGYEVYVNVSQFSDKICLNHTVFKASMAQLDARPTGDQQVAGSTPAEVGNILCDDYEIFSVVILSLLLIQEGQLSVSGERMCTILVNQLED